MHILMNGQILMKNLNTRLYLRKNTFILSLRDGKRNRNDGHISDEQYQHLQNVWDIFNFNTFMISYIYIHIFFGGL